MRTALYRIAQVIVLLAVASTCHANDFMYFKKKAAGGGGGSWSCSDANILCESFEGSNAGYDTAGWVQVITGSSSIDNGAAIPGSFSCADKGVESLKIAKVTTGTGYSHWHTAGTNASVYGQTYLYVDTSTLPSYNQMLLFSAATNSDVNTFSYYAKLNKGASTYTIQFYFYNGTGFTMIESSTINLQTWYRVSWVYVTSGNAQLYLNGVQQGVTGTAGADRPPQYFLYGTYSQDDGGSTTYYFDDVKINASSAPAACP